MIVACAPEKSKNYFEKNQNSLQISRKNEKRKRQAQWTKILKKICENPLDRMPNFLYYS
jgi:hypothetical protein